MVTSGARSASSAATWPRPAPATTISRRGDSSRAAAITWPSIVWPPTGCSTLGTLDFIRVPSPAARTITAAGTLALTQLLGIGAGPRRPAASPGGQDQARIPSAPAAPPESACPTVLPGEDSNLG